MCDDQRWIMTLMDEAENEGMHLMTFIEMAKPTWYAVEPRLVVAYSLIALLFLGAVMAIRQVRHRLRIRRNSYYQRDADHPR